MKFYARFLDAGANPNVLSSDGSSALLIASSNGDTDAVKALLGAGANPNHALPNGQTVLMSATVNGYATVIDLLIDAGADVNAIFPDGRFGALALALDSKKMRIALQLFCGTVHSQILASLIRFLWLLLNMGAWNCRRSLIHAADPIWPRSVLAQRLLLREIRIPEVLDYLLNHGIDLSVGNDLGYTPLILASLANHLVWFNVT